MRRMTAALVHRGPDDEAYYGDATAALGFRRLSIVDLQGGRQPIANETDDLFLVCNGEIYNSPALRRELEQQGHRFRSHSDVEVILHLYEELGLRCFERLQGMFALALWDRKSHELVLARDHMGQKPLFYYHHDTQFYFASEVQALMAGGGIKRQMDTDALWHYLSLRYMPDRYSLVRGVQKLPAASYLVLRDNKVETGSYWRLDFRCKAKLSDADACDALDERLQQTTQLHLLSDVEVGAFISSGIDSTTISSIAARLTPQSLPVFCVGSQSASFDELPGASKVAAANGMRFFGEQVKPDIAGLLPTMVHHLGEPADPYGVGIYLVSRLAAQHVKVVLSGDGGDENFGGYDRYLGQRIIDLYQALPGGLRRPVLSALLRMVPETFTYKSLAQRLRWIHELSDYSDGQRYARSLGFLRFTPESKQELFTETAQRELSDADSVAKVLTYFDSESAQELVDKMLNTDLMTRVRDHNLVMGDRMSMAHSLEVRAPLLDPRLMEFAASLPTDLKIRGRQLKYLLRKVAARYVPKDIVRLPKQGFGFPIGEWLRSELRATVESRLNDSKLVQQGTFRPQYIKQLMDEHMAGSQDHSYRLWLLLGLEVWYDLYIEGQAPETISLARP